MTGSNWNKVNLEAAFLNDSNLAYTVFHNCNFINANLPKLSFYHTVFEQYDLLKAYLRSAKSFNNIRFSKSNLKGANFSFCDKLSYGHELTQEQIEATIGDETTILPDHLTMPESWNNKQQ
ncbi:pentapeptide repeat-containing protein [Crocosphaera sp. Alani8]|uniref:pentapeptide repeat-containing protein n=1 Tax=Crocosphaera sp. Alani8 TaxID=3038952 RepID=UPI00313D80F4